MVGVRWGVSEQPFSSRGPAHPRGRLGCAARSWPADGVLCWRHMRAPEDRHPGGQAWPCLCRPGSQQWCGCPAGHGSCSAPSPSACGLGRQSRRGCMLSGSLNPARRPAGLQGLEVQVRVVAWSCGVPPFGAPFGSPWEQSRACPCPPQVGGGAALPWVLLCGRRRAPGRTVTLCLQAAASSRRCHERAQPPTEAGPIAVWTAGRWGLGRSGLGGSGQARAPPPPPLPATTGVSWASPTALYLGQFGARRRRSQRSAGGLGLCRPGPLPTEPLRSEEPPEAPPPGPTGPVGVPRGPKASAAQVCGFAIPSTSLCRAASLDRGPGHQVLTPEAWPHSGPAPRARSHPGPGAGQRPAALPALIPSGVRGGVRPGAVLGLSRGGVLVP